MQWYPERPLDTEPLNLTSISLYLSFIFTFFLLFHFSLLSTSLFSSPPYSLFLFSSINFSIFQQFFFSMPPKLLMSLVRDAPRTSSFNRRKLGQDNAWYLVEIFNGPTAANTGNKLGKGCCDFSSSDHQTSMPFIFRKSFQVSKEGSSVRALRKSIKVRTQCPK